MASPVLGSATSPAYEAARFPVGSNSRTAAFSFATSRPLMMTEPPSAMKRAATSLPIPDAPPVITATLSPNLIATSIHYLSVGRLQNAGCRHCQPLSIDRQRSADAVNEAAERLMDLAESHIRNAGYGGFSFRDLAAEIGIKSASVHHHFPTKATMAAAVARRYADRFLAAVVHQPNETAEEAIAMYRSAFRTALDRDGRMCLCGVLGAEAGGL